MAEIVSISASIITVLDLCTKSVRLLRNIRDAPEEYKSLHMAICATKGVVDDLQETVTNAEVAPHNAWLKTIPSLVQDDGAIGCLRKTLTSLADQLDGAVSAKGIKKIGKRLRWPIDKEDAKTIVGMIELQQKTLMLAFQNDSLILAQETHNSVKVIQDDTRTIREDTRVVRKDIEKVENGLGILTVTSTDSLQRIEGEMKSSAFNASHDVKQISALISVSFQENRKTLEDLHTSIKQSVARHSARDIVILNNYQRAIMYYNKKGYENSDEEEVSSNDEYIGEDEDDDEDGDNDEDGDDTEHGTEHDIEHDAEHDTVHEDDDENTDNDEDEDDEDGDDDEEDNEESDGNGKFPCADYDDGGYDDGHYETGNYDDEEDDEDDDLFL